MANAIDSLNYGNNVYTFTLPYALCTSGPSEVVKEVTVSNFSLETGARIAVRFPVTNTAQAPILNVNDSGDKLIYYDGSIIVPSYLKKDRIYEFIYTGTRWDLIGDIDTNTTYTFNGAVSTIKDSNLTTSRALISNSSGKVAVSDVTSTELGYLDGVTSNVQTQLDGKMDSSSPVCTDSFSMGRKSGTTVGSNSVAVGNNTTASGNNSHAEGSYTTASGNNSHAEGAYTTASGNQSHAEGSVTTASGTLSHAGGYYSEATGDYSYTHGYYTIANNYQYVVGKYNKDTTAPTSLSDTTATAGIFIVGIGTGINARSNGFRINPAGKPYALSTMSSSGADYAEYFEWIDGNPADEDRRGRFVTLDGEKIRYATAEDDYILGVVSAEPTVVGDSQSEAWRNMYLKDIYGERVVEVVEVEESVDEHGDTIPAHIERRWVLNPDYDPEKKYTSREERPEWDAIGIVGKLVAVDDGTCQVNGYCYPDVDGVATMSESKTAYRVIERLDNTHIRIFIK